MRLLLAFVLCLGCVLSISGEVINTEAVQTVFDKFDTLIKTKSAVVCVMSAGELNEIEKAFVRNEDRLSAELSIHFSSTCSDVDKMKTELLKLKNDFIVLINEPICSYDYRNLKASYESKILQFKNLLDSTKKIASGEQLETVGVFQNEFQMHQNHISEVLRSLESEQKLLNDANVQIAITELQQGKLDETVTALAKVTDLQIQIEHIVASVYGNGDNFENIHRFVKRLPLSSRINGYKALIEQLKKNNHMDHHIWILATEVQDLREHDGGLMKPVMKDLKTIVLDNSFDGLIDVLNKNGPEGLEALKLFAPIFVRTIYEETGNSVEKLLTVLSKLTFVRHRLYLINELVLMLKSTDRMHGKDMSLLVYELIKLRTIKRPQNTFWQNLIERNLPAELRDLMYNNLCIQNARNDEYLLAGEPIGGYERAIYTGKAQPMNDSYFWQIYFIDNGNKVLIKNNKYNEHLYVFDEGRREDEHVLRTWMNGSLMGDSKAEFYLDMLGDGQFLIVNKFSGQAMYSPFNDLLDMPNTFNGRPVFAKRYDPKNIPSDMKWILGICRLDVKYEF